MKPDIGMVRLIAFELIPIRYLVKLMSLGCISISKARKVDKNMYTKYIKILCSELLHQRNRRRYSVIQLPFWNTFRVT